LGNAGARQRDLSAGATHPRPAPLSYTWTITRPDATTSTLSGASASFIPTIAGNYSINLTVADVIGALATLTSTLNSGQDLHTIRIDMESSPEFFTNG
jgi:hypothetical protein